MLHDSVPFPNDGGVPEPELQLCRRFLLVIFLRDIPLKRRILIRAMAFFNATDAKAFGTWLLIVDTFRDAFAAVNLIASNFVQGHETVQYVVTVPVHITRVTLIR